MADKVFANGWAVSGKAADHEATTIAAVDVHFHAPQKAPPMGYMNWIATSALGTEQTTNTTLYGAPIWNKKGLLDGSPSLPPHPDYQPGIASGNYQGLASAVTCSPDVIVEGAGVVRFLDTTKQNCSGSTANCYGLVLKAGAHSLFMDGDTGKALDGAGEVDHNDGDPSHKLNRGADGDNVDGKEDKTDDKTGDDEQKECAITSATAKCSHGRSAKDGALGVLDGDTISFSCVYDGACACEGGTKHPLWTGSGALGSVSLQGQTSGSAGVSCSGLSSEVKLGGLGNVVNSVAGLLELMSTKPAKGTLKVEAKTGSESFDFDVYPTGSVTADFSAGLKVFSDGLKKLQEWGNSGSATQAFKVDGPSGTASVGGGWKEDKGPECFFEWKLQAGLSPVLKVAGRIYIPWGPAEPARKFLDKVAGVICNLFVEASGQGDLVGTLQSAGAGGGVTGDVSATLSLTLTAGLHFKAGKAVNAQATGSCSVSYTLGVTTPLVTLIYGPLTRGALVLKITIEVDCGLMDDLWSWFEGRDVKFATYENSIKIGDDVTLLQKNTKRIIGG